MCTLCQENGGECTTHNTGDCMENEKDGTLKKGFKNTETPSGRKPTGQNFIQAMKTKFSKLQKSIKKDKTCKKKRKCDYDSDSSNNS